jgi:membrane protease subunit (stomatin/prohibitin family)
MPDLFGKLKGGAEKVAFEADKMARLNRARGEVDQVKRQIESQYTKLGEMYYQQYAHPAAESPAYDEICQDIAGLESKLDEKQAEVQRINAESYNPQGGQAVVPGAVIAAEASAPDPAVNQPPGSAPQQRFCPNCGQELTSAVKFCTNCGAKLA